MFILKRLNITIVVLIIFLSSPLRLGAEIDVHDSDAIRLLRSHPPYLNMRWRIKITIEGRRKTGFWYNDTQPIVGTDSVSLETEFSLKSLDPTAPMARDIERHRFSGNFSIHHPGFDIPVYSTDPDYRVRCEEYRSGPSPITIEIVGGILEPDNGSLNDTGLYWIHFNNSNVASQYVTDYYDIKPYCTLPYGCANFDVDCVYYDQEIGSQNHVKKKRLTGALLQWLTAELPLVPGRYIDSFYETSHGIIVRYTLSTVGPECPNLCDDRNTCTRDRCEDAAGCVHRIDDSLIPPQQSPNDCKQQVCRSGSVVTIHDSSEERITGGDYPHDCFLGTTCQCDDTETPLEDIPPDKHDCFKYVCRNCNSTAIPDDAEEPIDEAPDPRDCVKLVCLDGNPTDMPDKSERPLSADEICCEGISYEKYPASEPGKQFTCVGQGWEEHIELIPISAAPR